MTVSNTTMRCFRESNDSMSLTKVFPIASAAVSDVVAIQLSNSSPSTVVGVFKMRHSWLYRRFLRFDSRALSR